MDSRASTSAPAIKPRRAGWRRFDTKNFMYGGLWLCSVVFVLLLAGRAKADGCVSGYNTNTGTLLDPCPLPCDDGCTSFVVQLPNGGLARVCGCNSIGPQPECCKIAMVPDGQGGTTHLLIGSCTNPGCQGSGTCSEIWVWESGTVFGACLGGP